MCKMCCVHAALLLTTTISPLPPSLLCCIPPVVTRIPAMKSCGPGHNFNLYNTEYSDCSKLHICKYSSKHGRNPQPTQPTHSAGNNDNTGECEQGVSLYHS